MHRSASSAARSPVSDEPLDAREEGLEVDVPDPRDVAAVGDRVVQREDEDPRGAAPRRACGRPRSRRRGSSRAAAGARRSPTSMRSKRPNAGRAAWSPVDDLVGRGAERAGERCRRQRVVDVVEAGQRRSGPAACLPAATRSNEVASSPCNSTDRAPSWSGGRPWPQRGAAVVAEMADVGGGVDVRRAAAEAVLRVGGVLERGAGLRGIVEAERDAARAFACEIADLRVVGVDDERRVGAGARRLRHASARRSAPARRSGRAGRERGCPGSTARGRTPPCDVGKRALVHLEQAELARRAHSSRVEATPETRFAPELLCASRTRGERIDGDERGRRRLPVRRRDDRRPPAEAARRAPRARRGRSWPGSCLAASFLRRVRRGARAGPRARASATSRARRIPRPV